MTWDNIQSVGAYRQIRLSSAHQLDLIPGGVAAIDLYEERAA